MNNWNDTKNQGVFGILILLLAAIVDVFLVILRQHLLSQKFFSDSDQIQRIAQGKLTANGDDSFSFIAHVYRFLGVADSPLIAGFLGIGLPFLTFLFVIHHYNPVRLTITGSIYIFAFVVLTGVFLGTYSKDVAVSLIVLLMVKSGKSWKFDLVLIGLMVLYGHFVRSYWLLIAIAYLLFRLLPKMRTMRSYILFMVIVVTSFSLMLYYALGISPDGFRNQVNVDRIGAEDAASAIEPFVTTVQPLQGVLNNLIMIFALISPVPLLGNGAYHTFLFISISSMWIIFILSLRRWTRLKYDNLINSTLENRSIALLVSFLAVQALFEPDYGSALRHLSPLFPLMLVIFLSSKNLHGLKKKDQVNASC